MGCYVEISTPSRHIVKAIHYYEPELVEWHAIIIIITLSPCPYFTCIEVVAIQYMEVVVM